MYFVLNLSSKDTTVPWYTCLSEPGQYHNNYFIYLCLNEAAVFAEKRRSQEGTGRGFQRGCVIVATMVADPLSKSTGLEVACKSVVLSCKSAPKQ